VVVNIPSFVLPKISAKLRMCVSWNHLFCAITPTKRGIFRMYAIGPKVVTVIACALAMAIVIHLVVYLGIDAGSLSAEMPAR
jgi:hypothetical protein